MGVGNLAGADLAKDAAKVEALQIKQDLSAKTLAIAAEQPRGCSAYLKNYLAVEAESLAHNRTLMGEFTLSRRHTIIGWLGVVVMLVAVVAMFATM